MRFSIFLKPFTLGKEKNMNVESLLSTCKQCGIKYLMGCKKIKTKMVSENILHNRTLRGDKIHDPLSHSSPFCKFWSTSRRKQLFEMYLKVV